MSDPHIVAFDDPDHHHSVQRLLPWYLSGRLDGAEQARVAAHLGHCALCRTDLAEQQQLRQQLDLAQVVPSPEQSFARLRGRLMPLARPVGPAWWSRPREWLRSQSAPVLWALAGQSAMIAVLAVLLVRAPAPVPTELYVTRGALVPAAAGVDRILVGFAGDATLNQLRLALRAVRGRIADGPTDTGVCVVEIPGGTTAMALVTLRGEAGVRLAESLGPEVGR